MYKMFPKDSLFRDRDQSGVIPQMKASKTRSEFGISHKVVTLHRWENNHEQ